MSNQNQNQSTKLKGSRRDSDILRTIEAWGVMNTDQVEAMFFAEKEEKKPFLYGKRKTQEVLLRLYKTGKLQRKMVEGVYCYYLDPKGLLKHRIGVNWVRMWTPKRLSGWEKLHSWSYEQDYKILRCDGFIAIKNTVTGGFKFTFLELDRGTNTFDKVTKYNTLYDQEKYTGWWWVPLAKGFPTVQVVTVSPARKRFIEEQIEAGNKNKLEFKVQLLDDMRREVMERCCSPMCPPDKTP